MSDEKPPACRAQFMGSLLSLDVYSMTEGNTKRIDVPLSIYTFCETPIGAKYGTITKYTGHPLAESLAHD